jgi:mono/diheme cytochrome c family protein
MLKPFLLLSAMIVLVLGSTPAPGRPPQEAAPASAPPASTNPVKPTAASQEKAKALYTRDCAFCHGDNGNGKTDVATSMQLKLDDWADPKTLAAKADQQLFDAIRKGKGDKMPAEDVGRAKNDEVWNLIIYIRGLSKGQPAPPPEPAAAPPQPDAAPPQPQAAPPQPEAAPPQPQAAPPAPSN